MSECVAVITECGTSMDRSITYVHLLRLLRSKNCLLAFYTCTVVCIYAKYFIISSTYSWPLILKLHAHSNFRMIIIIIVMHIDINECLDQDICGPGNICINEEGSYMCACHKSGYYYVRQERNCIGKMPHMHF